MISGITFLFRYVILALGFFLNPIAYYFTGELAHLFLNPIGILFFIFAVGAILGNRYCFKQWFWFDVAIATLVYGTQRRTISGVVGQRANETQKKRWTFQARIIDRLAIWFGDRPNHCLRAFLWEKKQLKF